MLECEHIALYHREHAGEEQLADFIEGCSYNEGMVTTA